MTTITLDPNTITWLRKHLSILHTEWLLEKRRIAKSGSPTDSAYAVTLETDITEVGNVLDALEPARSTQCVAVETDPPMDPNAATARTHVSHVLECVACEATVPINNMALCEGWYFTTDNEGWLCPRCAMNAEVDAHNKGLLADLTKELQS